MRIAYVGIFQFPEGDAGAARVLGIGRALRECGHSVIYFGIEKLPQQQHVTHMADYSVSEYHGFNYRSPCSVSSGFLGKLKRHYSIFVGATFIDRLDAEESDGRTLDVVIAYQVPSIVIARLKHWCSRRRIPLICDAVEWYDPKQLFMGMFGPIYWDSELRMRFFHKWADGIISISRYLTDYYSNSRIPIITVPPLTDVGKITFTSNNFIQEIPQKNKLRLVYAGVPGNKDLLGNVLRGVLKLRERAHDVTIKLVGVSREKVLSCLCDDADTLDKLGNGLILHPRIPRSQVHAVLSEADFMPLLRPNKKYSNAGFPTKVVECQAAGIPVIANLTSNLDEYLIDGVNGYIAGSPSVESFIDAVERALANRGKWGAMRQASKKCAEEKFDYRAYSNDLDVFVRAVFTVIKGDIYSHVK